MSREHLVWFALLMMATAARPDAIRELTKAQIDFEHGLIQLSPKGRPQTKGYRPTEKLPEAFREMLENAPDRPLVRHGGQPVRNFYKAWRNARERAGLDDEVKPYSLRHTLARWMRKEGRAGLGGVGAARSQAAGARHHGGLCALRPVLPDAGDRGDSAVCV